MTDWSVGTIKPMGIYKGTPCRVVGVDEEEDFCTFIY